MRLRSLKCLHGVFALLLLLAGALAVAAAPAERGFPLIQTYEPALPEAATQSYDVVRDPRGILYFANLSGVLVYDGAWWQLIKAGKGKTAFSVVSDEAGRVAVGGVDELGYLGPDSHGKLRYVSLLPLLTTSCPAWRRRRGATAAWRRATAARSSRCSSPASASPAR